MPTTALVPAAATPGSLRLRPIDPADHEECAQILYGAFAGIHDHHRFARDFPTIDAALDLTGGFIAHPSIWGVVAEIDGRIVGSNFLDERDPVRGVGPITVAPEAQGRGVGRHLMKAVIERGAGAAGIRLLQDAFNTSSLSLYASLGFEVKEPVVLLRGRPRDAPSGDVRVRPLREADLPSCDELHRRVRGHARANELRDALVAAPLTPYVAVRDGRIVAYATTLTSFPAAHAAAETQADLAALIAGATAAAGEDASFLLPSRQTELLRWALREGLQVVKPMTYMALGAYREPTGAWLPSVLA